MPQPYAANTTRADNHSLDLQFIGCTGLAMHGIFQRITQDVFLNLRGNTIAYPGLVPGFLQQSRHTFFLQCCLYIVIVTATYTQSPACFAYIAKLF
jgi:hypothetical protein